MADLKCTNCSEPVEDPDKLHVTYAISSVNPALKFDNPDIIWYCDVCKKATPGIKTVLTTDNLHQRVQKLETNITPVKLADSVLNTATFDLKAG